LFYWIVKTLFWPIGRLYFRMRVVGNVPGDGPVILAANHCSLLDPAILGSACARPVRFMITRRLYDRPSQRWFYRGMRAIPVSPWGLPDHAAIRGALGALRAGMVVGIFPEGVGLDPDGRLRSPRQGASLIAAWSGAPVVPVGIEGTHKSLPKGGRFPRPGRIKVTFGEPFRIPAVRSEGDRKEVRQEGADEVMRRIASLLGDGA